MALDPAPVAREAPDKNVVERYTVIRGVGNPNSETPHQPVISLRIVDTKEMLEEDGVTPKTNNFGTIAYRKAQAGAEWQFSLEAQKPAHLARIQEAMVEACADMVAFMLSEEGLTRTEAEIQAIAQAMAVAGYPDAALARAMESVEMDRQAGTFEVQAHGEAPPVGG